MKSVGLSGRTGGFREFLASKGICITSYAEYGVLAGKKKKAC
jgi:hypothetical protein